MPQLLAVEAWVGGLEARAAARPDEVPGIFASAIRGTQGDADGPSVEREAALSARPMHYTLRRADLERAHEEALALAAALQADLANAGSADGQQVLFARLSGPAARMFDERCCPTSPSLEIPEASDVDDDDETPPLPASPAGSSPPPAGSSLAGSPSPSPTRSSLPPSPSLNFDDEVPGALTLRRGTSEVDEEELPTLSRQYSDGTSEVDDEEPPASLGDDVSSHARSSPWSPLISSASGT